MSKISKNLTPREEHVLKAVVEDYILKNTPIGSNLLKIQHSFNCSPATLRNVMANLEKRKLLMHAHTSSGRIPTDLGYRYYVENLMDISTAVLVDQENIQDKLDPLANNISELLQTTAAILAKVTHLFGVAMIIDSDNSILSELELISLSSDRVMLVIGMDSGLLHSIVIDLNLPFNEREISKVNAFLKEKILGLTLKEILNTFIDRLSDSSLSQHEVIQILVRNPDVYFSIPNEKMIYTSSQKELFEQPEFKEMETLKKSLIAFDNNTLAKYFNTYIKAQTDYLLIGNENLEDIYCDYTIVTNVFKGSLLKGQIGIIGPTRFPYSQITGLLKKFTEIMNRVC